MQVRVQVYVLAIYFLRRESRRSACRACDMSTHGSASSMVLSFREAWSELRPEEASALLVLALMCVCGSLQLVFAVTIPNFGTGMLGLLVLSCATMFAQEIWQYRRIEHLLLGVFQPVPFIMLAYVDYVMLVSLQHIN